MLTKEEALTLVEDNGWAINPSSFVDYDEWVTYWEVIERYSHDGKPHEKDKVLGTADTITDAVMIAAEMVCPACLYADDKHAPGCPDDPEGEGP